MTNSHDVGSEASNDWGISRAADAQVLEAASECGNAGCAKVVVETRGSPKPKGEGACEQGKMLVG